MIRMASPRSTGSLGRHGRHLVVAGIALVCGVAVALALTQREGGVTSPTASVRSAPRVPQVRLPTRQAMTSAPSTARPAPAPHHSEQQPPLAPFHHRFPVVMPSTDSRVPERPVPATPAAAFETSLGACCSEGRHGRPIDAIVVHTTEIPDDPGIRDLVGLAHFFERSTLGAHVADDAEGNTIRMVDDSLMAYHSTYWNVTTLGIEQMGFSVFSRSQWLARPAQLETTAHWIAHWARRYRIPIRRCVVDGISYNRRDRVISGRFVRRGICSHAQLDPRNRDDPGRGYPWDVVLSQARAIARAAI
jgi:N-acetylmuramoyl-L-alanine amidase